MKRSPAAQYFDEWYSAMAVSQARDEIVRRHLALPADLLSTGLLAWDGIADINAALRLSPGQVLADLACGRGGYGLEIAHRTGAQLVGVDLSAEAIRQARDHARQLDRPAHFQVGDLAASGLPDASAHAVICIDAVQFVESAEAAFQEIRRILTPGGRVVVTCWEAVRAQDDRVPPVLRGLDLRSGLNSAGFVDIVVEERPDWQAIEHALWLEAAALDPGSDPALVALHGEGVRALAMDRLCRRVMASATAP